MRVEACCQALLKQILPDLDPTRRGTCLDVGVGTFAFYCQLFAQLGFATVAVEPCPTARLKALCQRYAIDLVEQCLSDRNGSQTLYMGEFARFANPNFNSLAADWFAASGQTRQVPTLDLPTLLTQTGTTQVTALKLDIEGWEGVVMSQLNLLPAALLPALVMFEYGGGSRRDQGRQGWSGKFLDSTLGCIKTLQTQGYGQMIVIDYAAGTRAELFNLPTLDLGQTLPFHPQSLYGNIIALRQQHYPETDIQKIAAPYQGGMVHWLVNRWFA
ncbi:MAG: FkbM family methyltransferase [Cyanobacteriota bacterium]|jgi:FkbM family methyltransferase|nr:FkbM family methyltransferase [Cyanobacteriota bacterium]